MSITQPQLPYDIGALEPYISSETMSYHYDKHQRGYVAKLNRLIEATPYQELSLEDIIERARETGDSKILNNALQVWNHTFLWKSFAPGRSTQPNGHIAQMIENDFGDLEAFKTRFREAALDLFGSGWVWLVEDNGRLRIVTTRNADSPACTAATPLLVLDVWEHAYYIDYRNERGRYVDNFLGKLINWDFAAANLVITQQSRAA